MVPALTAPREASTVLLLHSQTDEPRRFNVTVLPHVLHDLTLVQRHILGRVAVHSWTHNGAIPFVAPNAHQLAVALELAAPSVHLLEVIVLPVSLRQSFRLTHLGSYMVQHLFRLVPAREDQRRECEFTRMRQFMYNDWATHN
jgi:hypothetical protein